MRLDVNRGKHQFVDVQPLLDAKSGLTDAVGRVIDKRTLQVLVELVRVRYVIVVVVVF